MEKTELIFKVLSKEATAQEVNELETWINLDPINKSDYEDLKILWEGHAAKINSADSPTDDGFQRIRLAIRQKEKKKKIAYIIGVGLLLVIFFTIIRFFVSREQERNNREVVVRFEHVTLASIASKFNEKYRVLLDVPVQLQACEFTGVLYNDSPEDALKFITESLNLEFSVINQHSYKIRGNGCN